jgi:hypothetical protein
MKEVKLENSQDIRKWMESEEYDFMKNVLSREINSNPVRINFSVFRKTYEEKVQLKKMKRAWRRDQEKKNILK